MPMIPCIYCVPTFSLYAGNARWAGEDVADIVWCDGNDAAPSIQDSLEITTASTNECEVD